MSETIVVNCFKRKFDAYIGRDLSYSRVMHNHRRDKFFAPGADGYLGNPIMFDRKCQECKQVHRDTEDGRAALVACYKTYFWRKVNADEEFRQKVAGLKGYTLGCFCAPKACHGDVIKAWLDAGCPLKEVK